ncbi:MAG: nitroreductase family protein [Spirochaetes bacterium]|nr:nitroreductase family protein [Spirochaetota bacterium]
MELNEIINKRRAFRSLSPVKINEDLVRDLASRAGLSASCFNNQPWKFVFVYEEGQLKKMFTALSQGNQWAESASMIIAVCGKEEDDCTLKDGRKYHLFDIGMTTAFLILRATELGLVAHPIAGYSPEKTKEILGIPDDMNVITLIIVGKHSDVINPVLSEQQVKSEKERPVRKDLQEIMFLNKWEGKGF